MSYPLGDQTMRLVLLDTRHPLDAAGRQLGERLVGLHQLQVLVRLQLEIASRRVPSHRSGAAGPGGEAVERPAVHECPQFVRLRSHPLHESHAGVGPVLPAGDDPFPGRAAGP